MLTINFSPFPNLETERLILRRVSTDDINEIFALRSNPETMKYIPRPLVTNEEEALAHFKMIDDKIETNEGINWAITLKGNNTMIGLIGHYRIKPEHYRAEVGYMILPEYHGKGITTEAVQCVVDYGFTRMKLHSIEGVIDPENEASQKVLQKCGFVKEAHFKENEYFDGKFIDAVVYSILNK
ncbi:ribosomal-protein-alanine N-acetyltransferase [Flavobacterium succinicans]|uniref:Ribosomal-protein-alanine N-acetyltransferase n=1 Tax=Flavobacterium succinicans TaxID=29536 RepID=A0A1I4WW67_9FLAO|nr:GNAT family N-acetyltransferase [Flavobacterium succinicans]SFN17717.1 ribosomal-protein-alanine N-acetyltransferase [Flavobacterium succinicans]